MRKCQDCYALHAEKAKYCANILFDNENYDKSSNNIVNYNDGDNKKELTIIINMIFVFFKLLIFGNI